MLEDRRAFEDCMLSTTESGADYLRAIPVKLRDSLGNIIQAEMFCVVSCTMLPRIEGFGIGGYRCESRVRSRIIRCVMGGSAFYRLVLLLHGSLLPSWRDMWFNNDCCFRCHGMQRVSHRRAA